MEKKKGKVREYIEAIIIAVVIAFFVRSFFIQAFKIPSGSMEPTLLVGDHLLVNRLSYVAKVPFSDTVMFEFGEPKRGDVIVFRWPKDRSKDFIKRVIAIPGDRLEIKGKEIFINGSKINDPWGHFIDKKYSFQSLLIRENLGPVVIPKDSYFVLGDNRDNSQDSRYWGFVEKSDLVGKALIIYFSWNSKAENPLNLIRWQRIGGLIK